MIQRFLSLFNTVRYLHVNQIRYQIWYRLKFSFIKVVNYTAYQNNTLHPLISRYSRLLILSSNKYLGKLSFSFLNLGHQFKDKIDWNFTDYGKLWNYNLQYFDFLLDDSIPHPDKQFLLEDFSVNLLNGTVKPEPYPVSLRLINWLLYFSETGYQSENFERALKCQVNYLEKNIEFHIQANHLLENYIALFISGLALNDKKIISKAWLALLQQFNEQVLADGGHYECSPMYHSVILGKLMLVIDVLENQDWEFDTAFLKDKAQQMLGWLEAISFSDKTWPNLNDATVGIAPMVTDIMNVAEKLYLVTPKKQLKESGYRKFQLGDWEVIIDAGDIMPSYQPGHAHSDMLAFYLQINNQPILVDTGTSTYQSNLQRSIERSTLAHNTVVINGNNQSDVWGGFRVGVRAKITIHQDSVNFLDASHDGYKRIFGKEHFRSFQLTENSLVIKDRLVGKVKKNIDTVAAFHFDKDCRILLDQASGKIFVNNTLEFSFNGHQKIEQSEYQQAVGFNRLEKSTCVKVHFPDLLTTSIRYN